MLYIRIQVEVTFEFPMNLPHFDFKKKILLYSVTKILTMPFAIATHQTILKIYKKPKKIMTQSIWNHLYRTFIQFKSYEAVAYLARQGCLLIY